MNRVLIGPNVPHLNFDYGIETDYHQIVVQLKEHFLGDAFKETPEFLAIYKLFEKEIFANDHLIHNHSNLKSAIN